MHKFIFKHGDVDQEIIESIYEYLYEFYEFLANHGLVEMDELKDFSKNTSAMKSELLDKMQRYNAIRHNDELSDEEKEDIREELFEGDHEMPFL